ncbi:MAG TPA: galactose-1-phosphate uridylyltransferase [Planctomycetaceae bacterium]|nr:galactose-1-phosphate uridylyltransferase [Planctomycetaceae bacterium]
MPDLRKDPIVGRWVIVAENRAKRPHEFESRPHRRRGALCPFCEGHEGNTPDEILAYREPDSPPNREGWRVRVVPNKFPALEIAGSPNKGCDGIYDRMEGFGTHEVIIESPRHVVSTSDLSESQVREVLWVYRDRLVDLKQDRRLVYGMIFKNVGEAAGASIEHVHSQLIATPIVPVNVREEMTGSLDFYHGRGRCVYCDMIQQELAHEKRIVLDTPSFVALCPFAGRFPFETWILPKLHASHYENIRKNEVEELSALLRQVIGKIETALDRPAYNYFIHTAPFDTQELGHYHWHIEIMPSLTKAAGFEWGSGVYINTVAPEASAEIMRSVNMTAKDQHDTH